MAWLQDTGKTSKINLGDNDLWKWILIFAALVLAYYFLIHKNGLKKLGGKN